MVASDVDLPKKQFLDALASLGSMLKSQSVSQSLSNVFEILSNLGHVLRVCSGYVQSVFKVCSECVKSVLRVCSRYIQSMFRVGCQD